MNKTKKWYVVKLGGSILIPDLPDVTFLKEFRTIIRDRITNHNEGFLIIVGGGKTCRNYQDAIRGLGDLPEVDLDWIGIYTGRFNGELTRLSFGADAYYEVINRPEDLPDTKTLKESIVICGAEAPGHSFNFDAVVFADAISSKEIVNLSNIDYVYSADPKRVPDAKKYETVSWREYLTCIPEEWESGMSTPFDPISSREAKKLDIDVIFMKGNPTTSLKQYFETGSVEGTIISNRFE